MRLFYISRRGSEPTACVAGWIRNYHISWVYNEPMKYNKLVRDKIPEYIVKKGGKPLFHVANEAEYWEKLKEKLIEEIEEFKQDESIEEFADLVEVIDAIADYKKFDQEDVNTARKKKVEERGAFKDKIILDES